MRRLALILAVIAIPAVLITATAQTLSPAPESPAPESPAPEATTPEWTPPPADPQAEAQPPEAGTPETPESGLDLVERGVGTFFENLLREVQPQMEDVARGLDQTFNRFAPVFDDLTALMDDMDNYQAPERLPNGDILIRRLPDAPPPPRGNTLRDLTRPSEAPDAPNLPPLPGTSIDL